MSVRKLQEFREFRYGPRSVLQPGDRFRASGGPFYVNQDGTKTLMAERGTFVFRRYCEKGGSKWIEATRVGGENVVLWVGREGRNPDLPSFRGGHIRSARAPGASANLERSRMAGGLQNARNGLPMARPAGLWSWPGEGGHSQAAGHGGAQA